MTAGSEPDPIADAIAALTTAARRERTIGAGTPNEHTEPVDFGEIACHVITAVAANVGGVEALLAGRPGSWEADYVRQIVQSTAGDDDTELMRYRTEPVRIEVDIEAVFYDFGLTDLYDRDVNELDNRLKAADDALFEAYATAEERTRIKKIRAAMPDGSGINDDALAEVYATAEERTRIKKMERARVEKICAARTDGVDPDVVARVVRSESLEEEMRAIAKAIIQRAAAADDPLVAALTAAENAMSAPFELWEQDQAAYREAYTAAIRQALTDRGLMVEVEVVEARGEWEWDPLIDELHEYARKNAPLPMTGTAPDWTNGTPADALHRAGLTYLARAQATTR